MLPRKRTPFVCTALAATLLVLCTVTGPAFATTTNDSDVTQALDASAHGFVNGTTTLDNDNFNCPDDCRCWIAHKTHKPFLHAKCSSLNGLKTELPVESTLPIHSIDLSYLSLSRLAHSLDKLHDLTSIDLSHNELHEIGHLGRRIKKLNLKHNRITSIKLVKLPQHLQVLNLQHNDITYLPLEFTKLSQLHTLELSHNQINCSCETLEVRNWLQKRHVFMEHPVKCSYPPETSGKPWLQIKQSEICDKEEHGEPKADNENELMMGDQPFEGSGDNEDEEELGKAFLPIDKETTTPKSNDGDVDDVEGSGDLSVMNLPLSARQSTMQDEHTTEAPTTEEEDDDGSGSGGGLLVIPRLHAKHFDDMFGTGMGIFDGGPQTDKSVEEETIVPVKHFNVGDEKAPDADAEVTDDSEENDDSTTASEAIVHAEVGKTDDSNATYFLLGVIVLIVVGLIFYVGIRRCKQSRQGAFDAENQRQTELLDMDKTNVGKPVRNGMEHKPLIGEKAKSDVAKPINGAGSGKKPYDTKDLADGPAQQQPLLNANGGTAVSLTVPNESNNNEALRDVMPSKTNQSTNEQAPSHEYYPITPRYPTPKSPRASKYAQYPQGEHNNNINNNNNNHPDDAYLASSPKAGRYSPVYSPETGRVKIKLTETPKPKTPMLVTRSKSNAGEIITTPLRPVTAQTTPAVHVGGALNGHATAQ